MIVVGLKKKKKAQYTEKKSSRFEKHVDLVITAVDGE